MRRRRIPPLPWAWAWGAIALAFPWSNAFMSVATGLLGLAVLTRFGRLLGTMPERPLPRAMVQAGWSLVLLVLWSALSTMWSGDVAASLNDVRVKLPLAAGGLALVAMARESVWPPARWVDGVLKLGLASAVIATLAVVFLDVWNGGDFGGRQASRFISHIRFGLWWALLLPWVCHRLGAPWRWLALAGALLAWSWMESLTGLLVAVALAPWWLSAWRAHRQVHGADTTLAWPASASVNRMGLAVVVAAIPLLCLLAWTMPTSLPAPGTLASNSAGGEAYVHKLDRRVTENGHHVWIEVAWGELQRGWEARSAVPFSRIDGALVRFLTSKGLPKDAEGVAAMDTEEIAAVERGVPSVVELRGGPWSKRWNRFKYNWGEWLDGNRSPRASILARSVYQEVGARAWSKIPAPLWLTGCGPGVDNAWLDTAYAEDFPDWPEGGRKRPHNQYLTLLLSAGLIGLCLFLWSLKCMWMHAPARPGVLLVALSCLAEDTLETQAGVTLAIVALAWGTFIAGRRTP